MSDINKRGVENWLIEALKSYDGLMSTNPDKEHKWQAKLKLQALIQEQVRLARISELKQLEPPEQYEEYARIAGTDACYICGFNAVLFRKVIAERIKELKGDK